MAGRSKGEKSTAKQTCGTRRGNGPGKGEGWGGPAQGEGHTFAPGDPLAGKRLEPDAKAEREARIAKLRDHLFWLATNADRQETQLAAANAYLDREEGKPIARTVTATVDDVSKLSDLELTAELARTEREIAQAAARNGEAAPGEQASGVPPLH